MVIIEELKDGKWELKEEIQYKSARKAKKDKENEQVMKNPRLRIRSV